jgi:hypothetical protein
VLESARIMRRRMIEVNMRTLFAKMFFVTALATFICAMTTSCGGDERHAERMWRQAIELVERGDTAGAVDRLQKLIDTFPDTRVAAKAREQIIVYRGLATAIESYPSRRARELMVQIARAIEVFRREEGRVPVTLNELVPAALPSVPNDPWDRPFVYQSSGDGYRLMCHRIEGNQHGAMEFPELLVVNGEFRAVSP